MQRYCGIAIRRIYDIWYIRESSHSSKKSCYDCENPFPPNFRYQFVLYDMSCIISNRFYILFLSYSSYHFIFLFTDFWFSSTLIDIQSLSVKCIANAA